MPLLLCSCQVLPYPIVTWDPAYRTENAIFLSGLDLPIAVVSELHQYLSVTPSTLLIALYPHHYVPIWTIAADITFPTGPAAIICTRVFSHSWHQEGKIIESNNWTPRVGRMLEGMNATWLEEEIEVNKEPRNNFCHVASQWRNNMAFYAR